ncbi:MAG: LysM peptidoglycan-binding domain-containing protein [Solirubrobacteraceae bacterium]
MVEDEYSPDPTGRLLWYLVPIGIVIVLFAVGLMTVSALNDSGKTSDDDQAQTKPDLPDFWTVKRGQTISMIAQRTGLTIDELETFNPRVDPSGIRPGQRLQLKAKVAKPKPKPKGPRFRTVRSGESFGSIAADTGRDIRKLRRLNPNLKASELQPGDRLRLRR